MNTITQRVIKIVAEQVGKQPADIEMGKHLIADIGCDSLDIIEIMMHLEEEFGIEIDENEFEKLTTVAELIAAVADVCTQQHPPRQQFANDTMRQIAEMKATLEAHFALAQRIQQAALELDHLKNDPHPNPGAIQPHIDDLHACAATLAGDRAGELYGTEEDSETLRALTAGTACCSGEVTAGPGWAAVEGALA